MHEVAALIGYSRQHIYKLFNAGRFPKPFPVGDNSIRFLEHEIIDWINRKKEASRRGETPSRPRGRKAQNPVQRPWCTPDDAPAEEPGEVLDEVSEDEPTDT